VLAAPACPFESGGEALRRREPAGAGGDGQGPCEGRRCRQRKAASASLPLRERRQPPARRQAAGSQRNGPADGGTQCGGGGATAGSGGRRKGG
jgi:hypothetical protein